MFSAEVTCVGFSKYSGIVNIPQDIKYGMQVVAIGEKAFYECTELDSVSFPKTIYNIYDYAFFGCTKLKSITFPNYLAGIGQYAFAGCTALTSINIPKSVETISYHAFEGCTGLKSVDMSQMEGLSISDYAFAGCTELKSISFSNNLRVIGNHCFEGCKGLSSITIPNKVIDIFDFAFYGCNLSSITIGNDVTYIGPNAFGGNSPIQIVSLLENPCKIYGKTSGNGAKYEGTFTEETFNNTILYVPKGTVERYRSTDGWKDFNNIVEVDGSDNPINSEVEINNVKYRINTSTEVEVVHKDDYAGDIIIPEKIYFNTNEYKVTSIGKKAFYDCRELTSVHIPNSVTSIGDWAFRGCEKLASITIPNSVIHIGEWAFAQTGISSITVPNSIATLSYSVFNGCRKLTSIELPNNLIRIGDKAFYNCESLSSFTIPQSVTYVGEWSFSKCDKLTSIYIPNSVTFIGAGAFYKSYLNIIISDIENPFEITGTPIDEDKNEEGIFMRYTFNNATLFVPKGCVEKYKATNGWKNFNNIVDNPINTEVEVNNIKYRIKSSTEVEVIHKDDYSGDIVIPECVSINNKNYNVTSIASRAFNIDQYDGCSITSISIPNSVKTIGPAAFKDCKSLKEIKLPDDFLYLDTGFVFGCSSLVSIKLPSKLNNIGQSAISNCSKLKSIEIPDQVITIESFAFQQDKSLKTVITSGNLRNIYSYAFSYCDSIRTIVLGEKIESIGCNAFAGCNQLHRVYSLKPTPPALNHEFERDLPNMEWIVDTFRDTFESTNAWDVALYVPLGSKEIYQKNPQWGKLFKEIIEFDTSTFDPHSLLEYGISNPFVGTWLGTYYSDGKTYHEEWSFNSNNTGTVTTWSDGDDDKDTVTFSYHFTDYSISIYWQNGNSTFGRNYPFYISDMLLTLAKGDVSINYYKRNETNGIQSIVSDKDNRGVYSLKGEKLGTLSKGVNIIKMADGTTKKVLIK